MESKSSVTAGPTEYQKVMSPGLVKGLEKLTTTSVFENWRVKFLIAVKLHGLSKFFGENEPLKPAGKEEKKEWKKNQLKATHAILTVLDDSMVGIVREELKAGPWHMWQALVTHYRGSSLIESGMIREELFSLKMTESTTLNGFIDHINLMCYRLHPPR